jgi:hypothetical protein
MKFIFTGGDIELARGPGHFVVVNEFIAVVSDLLVGAVLAMFLDRALEKLPTFARFGEIQLRGFRKLLLESR